MSSDNAPKSLFEIYWDKYSEDRKRISDHFKTSVFINPAVLKCVRKAGWFIYQPYKWLFIAPFLVFSTVTLSTLAILVAIVTNAKTAGNIAVFWARVNSYFTPMAVKIKGAETLDKKQSCVIVANHMSLYDIYVLYGWLGIDFRWVMKQELRKVPAIGIVCSVLEHVYIDRSDSKKAIESINRAKLKIKNGTSIIFFPEGTRSSDGKLKPFKKRAFKLALDLGLPVLPVTINGTRNILGKGTMNLLPGTAELIIHPRIDTSGYDESTIDALIASARDTIESALTTGPLP